MLKQKIEKYLKSNYYLLTIISLIFIGWHVKAGPPLLGGTFFNTIVMIGLLIIWFFIVITYENMAYGIPIVLGFSYLMNSNDLNLKTLSHMLPLLIAAVFFVAGIIIHMIKFRKKLKAGRLTLGLVLMALASLIPFIYVKFTFPIFILSLVGFFHLVTYTIFDNYAQIDTKHFIRFLYYLSWLLVAQAWTRYMGYLVKNGLSSFPKGVETSWGGFGNFGWGCINDVFIHLLLLAPTHLYYMIKKPKNFAYWMGILVVAVTFLISGSRGGVMGLVIAVPFYIYILLRYGNQEVKKNLVLFIFIFVGVAISSVKIIQYILDGFIASLDNPTTGRTELWKQAIEVFKEYPLFGGGWGSKIMNWGSDQRVVVYHSTFFHTIAVMGIFGLIAVIINWWESFIIMLRKISLEKWLILVGFISSQAYGMVDITQHAAYYMSILVIQLLAIEKPTVRTTDTYDIIDFNIKPRQKPLKFVERDYQLGFK
ncbi:MAG: O-antigen ligase family protein [Acholeplasmataceae bacterium]|jgi:O-antigen ligase